MRRVFGLFLLIAFAIECVAEAKPVEGLSKILIELPSSSRSDTELIAVDRIREYSNATIHVVHQAQNVAQRSKFDLTVVMGSSKLSPEHRVAWTAHSSAKDDAYLVKTISQKPLVILAGGVNNRGLLYAVYRLADLIKAGVDLENVNQFFEPLVPQRYVSFGTTSYGRRYFEPSRYFKNLKELPRYGYNGVLIYPGGGTPIGQISSPVLEKEDGSLFNTKLNISQWKNLFAQIDNYGFDIVMTIPPMIPPGYSRNQIKDYYGGGNEPAGYLNNLKAHYRQFLKMLVMEYPEVDSYLFNSTEGATFGKNERFFGAPDDKFSAQNYLDNNTRIMSAYFDVLTEFFGKSSDKVAFWTHSFGVTSPGIEKMRDVLFKYPQVLILEDDFWNNNLWPTDLPAMAYLEPELRATIHKKNPFGMFQIATDGEYYGGGSIPNAFPGSHIRTAKDALSRNARMVVQRLDLHDRTPYGTLFGSMEIVPFAASANLWSPVSSEPDLWRQWSERRFGKKAAPFVVKALQQSQNILINGLTGNGIDLLAVGSEFSPRLWKSENSKLSRFQLFSKPGRLLTDKKPGDIVKSDEYTAYQTKTRSIDIREFLDKNTSALNSIKSGLSELESAKPYLHANDFEMLVEIFKNGENVLQGVRLLGQAAYATNLLLDNFAAIPDKENFYRQSMDNLSMFIKKGQLSSEINENLHTILMDYKQTGIKEGVNWDGK